MWPGFEYRQRCHMWVPFLVGSLSYSEKSLPEYSGLTLYLKNQHFQIPTRPGMALKKGTRNHYVDVLPLNRYLFIYFSLIFLRATFKLEPYCVMLALPRQSSFKCSESDKIWINSAIILTTIYILLPSNTERECCALLWIKGKVLLYLSWFYFYPGWFDLIWCICQQHCEL